LTGGAAELYGNGSGVESDDETYEDESHKLVASPRVFVPPAPMPTTPAASAIVKETFVSHGIVRQNELALPQLFSDVSHFIASVQKAGFQYYKAGLGGNSDTVSGVYLFVKI
jgi:hypothetical protein